MPEYYDELMETAISHAHSAHAQSKTKKNAIPTFFKSGRRIVYGDTGMQTNHYVGSADEKLYFKVKYTGGETGTECATLFYDSPRDYCVHYLSTLNKIKIPAFETEDERIDFFHDRVDQKLASIAPIVNAWRERRDEYLHKTLLNHGAAAAQEGYVIVS